MSAAASTYGEVVSGVLQREYGPLKHAGKLMARRFGVTPRAAENWLAGQCAPRGAELIRLMAHCDALRDEIMRLVEEARNENR